MTPLLAKQSEINNGVNVLEHKYIKYELFTFYIRTQCSKLKQSFNL